MNKSEIIEELVEFLNAKGQYINFLAHAEARGFDPDQLEDDIDSVLREE